MKKIENVNLPEIIAVSDAQKAYAEDMRAKRIDTAKSVISRTRASIEAKKAKHLRRLDAMIPRFEELLELYEDAVVKYLEAETYAQFYLDKIPRATDAVLLRSALIRLGVPAFDLETASDINDLIS